MARIPSPDSRRPAGFWRGAVFEPSLHFVRRRKKVLLAAVCAVVLVVAAVFIHYYIHFSHIVDARLSGPIFPRASLVLSGPIPVVVGEEASIEDVEDGLRKALYSAGTPRSSGPGTFRVDGNRLLIYPGPDSFFERGSYREGPAAITFSDGAVSAVTDLARNAPLDRYDLEPEVITTLFDRSRSKRRIVSFPDCPKVLVDAVLSAEDRRFFSHHGVNVFRLVEATVTDIRSDERLQGGSTLTMQLARNFFLSPKKTLKRKAEEVFLAMILEHRLSKEEIFTLYANQVYMGQRGSFSIYGFGEAADAYFNSGPKALTLPQAALLAGMIRGPNLYSPYRYPRRARDRRNWVLREMANNHYITRAEAASASKLPLGVTQRNVGGSQAPFFVDMVKDQLLDHLSQHDLLTHSYRIYTTLDPGLQLAAAGAVHKGMQEDDGKILKRRRRHAPPLARNEPEAALVVLDPHTGEVLALVGGRNYAASQLNRAVAMRQPGSSFKPFVYAAALSSGVDGSQPLITTGTVLPDQAESTFQFGNVSYSPKNYKEEYYGNATLREALALSLNVATVNLAQMVGYEKIKDLAVAAGLNPKIEATPAIALGAYDVTPVAMAGAYTIFANHGLYEAPRIILSVRDSSGRTLWQSPQVSRQVLDPRVSYLVVNLLETAIDHGTGEGARARGFAAPAAGKTGTLHDAWFAGFTSNLLAVAWVGYDSGKDLGLTGASAALPIWTDFMKTAILAPGYRKVQPFEPPLGVIVAPLDSKAAVLTASNPLATTDEVFIDGTQPSTKNPLSALANLLRKMLPSGSPKPNPNPKALTNLPGGSPAAVVASPPPAPQLSQNGTTPAPSAAPSKPEKSGGVFKKIFSIFKHHKPKDQSEKPGGGP
ncbi:MAG: PBP1A family penicillin-binding protein [Terriglobia bacterium]